MASIDPKSPPNPFSPGPKNEGPPQSNPAREAVDSLRGYAYQIAAASLAWLSLAPNERLYLEVAEDYAVCAENALKAVQVKDTAQSGNITLNSTPVREALTSFIDLVEKNADQEITFHYFTTSEIGTEKLVADRPGGEAGLKYWRAAAAGADVSPLRRILTADDMPFKVKAFVEARNDDALRSDLLRRIHWQCGKPDFNQIQTELELGIEESGRAYGLLASSVSNTAAAVMFRVLRRSTLSEREKRVLTTSELEGLLKEASRANVSQKDFDALLGALTAGPIATLGGGTTTSVVTNAIPSWIFLDTDIPAQSYIVTREPAVTNISAALTASPNAILTGATGLGKTLLAQNVCARLGRRFAIADFRDLDSAATARRLDALLGLHHRMRVEAFILDDLNHLEDPAVKTSAARLIAALGRRDQSSIITCYRKPSVALAAELSILPTNIFETIYFSEAETSALVKLSGGDPNTWGKLAHLSGAGGHPQLVKAFVLGMAARGWPEEELRKTVLSGFTTDDIAQSRDDSRRRLIEELPEDSRTLLFRLSFMTGSFARGLALALGKVKPPLTRPGEVLDSLTGSWVETLAGERFRISPLLTGSGAKIFSAQEAKEIHTAIARFLLGKGKISVTDADALFLHAYSARDAMSLMGIATSTISAPPEALEALSRYSYALPLLRTDKPLFEDVPAISVFLRLAQSRILLASDDKSKAVGVIDALLREIDDIRGEERSSVEAISLLNLLAIPGSAGIIPQWLSLIRRFGRLLASDPDLAKRLDQVDRPEGHEDRSVRSGLVLMGTTKMPSIEALEKLFVELNQMPTQERDTLLDDLEKPSSDYDLLTSGAWLSEATSKSLDWEDASARYLRMAEMATAWDRPLLAAYCYKSRGVMIDEYGHDPKAALDAMDDAERYIGQNDVLDRERLKILWRSNRYAEVVDLITPHAESFLRDHEVERMYAMREAAISAANTGRLDLAANWFIAASEALPEVGFFSARRLGLQVDAAVSFFNADDRKRAFELFAQIILRLPSIDGDNSTVAVYVRNIVRHAILWVKLHSEREVPRGPIIDDIGWLAGSGSNLEPPEAIRERPIGPIDIAWYLLAEAEIASDVDAGIYRNLPNLLQAGPISVQEMAVLKTLCDVAILKSDPVRFAKTLTGYLDSVTFVRNMPADYREKFNALNPGRGSIPRPSVEKRAQDSNTRGTAISAILSFLVVAALNGQFDSAQKAEQELASELGSDFIGRIVFQRLREEGEPLDGLQEEVVRLFNAMSKASHILPEETCAIGLRFSQFARQCDFKAEILPVLSDWLSKRWQTILENERFRLKSPNLHEPEIRKILDDKDQTSSQKVSALLLASCETAGLSLAKAYKDLLKSETKAGESVPPPAGEKK